MYIEHWEDRRIQIHKVYAATRDSTHYHDNGFVISTNLTVKAQVDLQYLLRLSDKENWSISSNVDL